MDSNPICHPSPGKKIKCLFLDYIQLLVVSWAGRWTRNPFATPLQPKNKMLVFRLRSTSDDRLGWSMDSNPVSHPSLAKKINCLILDYVQLLMIGRTGWWTRTHLPPLSSKKKLNACFWIMFNFWWLAGLVDGLEPDPPPLCSQKIKCLFLDYSSTSDDRSSWSMDSNPICHPSPAKKIKSSFLDYVQLLMIGWASRWTQTPSATPLQSKKIKCSFLDYI